MRQRLALLCILLTLSPALRADSIGANGVINFTDPNVEIVLGKMIAYGYNPWHYADERERFMVDAQVSANPYAASATWKTLATGTIAYAMTGIGPSGVSAGTTITEDLTASETDIDIADAGELPGLASLPTWILIGSYGAQEQVCISGTTATDGAATLTVCYDGRGMSNANGSPAYALTGAVTHSSGATVGEARIYGTSTQFTSDSNRPMCPAGSPGPPGVVTYSTGTVTLSASSATVTGSGTTWSSTRTE